MKTIDNFIEDKSLFYNIKETIFGNEFTWNYSDEVGSPLDKSGILFWHEMYFTAKGKVSPFFKLMHPIIGRLKFDEILRVKVNGYPKTHEPIKHEFHRDFPVSHKVALFSLNTNNGGTEFRDETFSNSVENRLLMFDGNLEHRSVTQTDENFRVNVNVDYV